MAPDDELVVVAARLARAAPQQWNAFLDALRRRHTTRCDHCISSPVTHLPVLQGRAQETRDFLLQMEKCKESADRLEKKK